MFGKSRQAEAAKLYATAAACKPADAMERLDVELAHVEAFMMTSRRSDRTQVQQDIAPMKTYPFARRRAALALVVLVATSCRPDAAYGQDKAAPAAPAAAQPVAQAVPQPAASAPRIDTLKRIRDTGAILIGVREASVPFSFLDAQKQPQGYSVDLCLRVADAIKTELKLKRLDVKYVPVSSANRIPALVEGKIDLECGSTTNTRDRQQRGRLRLHDVRRRDQDAGAQGRRASMASRTCAARRSSSPKARPARRC